MTISEGFQALIGFILVGIGLMFVALAVCGAIFLIGETQDWYVRERRKRGGRA
jgi:hypothetical protein